MIEPRADSRAYPYRKWRLFWLAVFGFFATLIAALYCVAAPGSSPEQVWLTRIVSGVAALALGALTAFAASRLIGGKPGLVLDHEGIIDNSAFSSVGRILWSEVVGVQVVRPPGFRTSLYGPAIRAPAFLVIAVRDPQVFIDRSPPLKRWLLRGNLASFGSPVAISPASVHIDTDELGRYIGRIVGPS
jgi:hypothetical protein